MLKAGCFTTGYPTRQGGWEVACNGRLAAAWVAAKATTDRDVVQLWNATSGAEAGRRVASVEVASLAFSSDGNLLLTAGSGGTIDVFSAKNDIHFDTFHAGDSALTDLSFSLGPNSLLATCDDEGWVRIWEQREEQEFEELHSWQISESLHTC